MSKEIENCKGPRKNFPWKKVGRWVLSLKWVEGLKWLKRFDWLRKNTPWVETFIFNAGYGLYTWIGQVEIVTVPMVT